jgi:antitoxin component YwqK of YwqJK toxin-antitoxin module
LNKKDPIYFSEYTFEGLIEKEGYRTDDDLNGEIRMYADGKLINIFTYTKGELNGPYAAYYYPTGKIQTIGFFKDSKSKEFGLDTI